MARVSHLRIGDGSTINARGVMQTLSDFELLRKHTILDLRCWGRTFNPGPKIGTDPASCGWTLVATVDTRPANQPPGGQYKVTITNPNGVLGKYRYLLFEMFPTETNDSWGHTFYSEITVTRSEGT